MHVPQATQIYGSLGSILLRPQQLLLLKFNTSQDLQFFARFSCNCNTFSTTPANTNRRNVLGPCPGPQPHLPGPSNSGEVPQPVCVHGGASLMAPNNVRRVHSYTNRSSDVSWVVPPCFWKVAVHTVSPICIFVSHSKINRKQQDSRPGELGFSPTQRATTTTSPTAGVQLFWTLPKMYQKSGPRFLHFQLGYVYIREACEFGWKIDDGKFDGFRVASGIPAGLMFQ